MSRTELMSSGTHSHTELLGEAEVQNTVLMASHVNRLLSPQAVLLEHISGKSALLSSSPDLAHISSILESISMQGALL